MNLSPETVYILSRDLTADLLIRMNGGGWKRRKGLRYVATGPNAWRGRLILAASEVEVWETVYTGRVDD